MLAIEKERRKDSPKTKGTTFQKKKEIEKSRSKMSSCVVVVGGGGGGRENSTSSKPGLGATRLSLSHFPPPS